MDECETRGAATKVEREHGAHYRKAEEVEDAKFREAYEKVWHLKNHNQKEKVS